MTVPHALLFCGLLFAVTQPPSDPPKADAADEEKAARLDFMKKVAKGYVIVPTADPSKKLTLTEEPILRFDDQVTRVLDGTVFVWSLDDRPAAVASIWIRKDALEFHEFQSLSTGPLSATDQGESRWTPAKPGLEWSPAAVGQSPAATPVGRLAQMRAFAQKHAATAIGGNDRIELRLLPQPVFRYGKPGGAAEDGAFFAYCKGTNPEVMLLVEAVKNGGKLEWQHAFVRMTGRKCEVKRDGELVWTVPGANGGAGGDPNEPYYNVVRRYAGPGAGK